MTETAAVRNAAVTAFLLLELNNDDRLEDANMNVLPELSSAQGIVLTSRYPSVWASSPLKWSTLRVSCLQLHA